MCSPSAAFRCNVSLSEELSIALLHTHFPIKTHPATKGGIIHLVCVKQQSATKRQRHSKKRLKLFLAVPKLFSIFAKRVTQT